MAAYLETGEALWLSEAFAGMYGFRNPAEWRSSPSMIAQLRHSVEHMNNVLHYLDALQNRALQFGNIANRLGKRFPNLV